MPEQTKRGVALVPAKQIELARQIVPAARKIGLLTNR
jgi:hypothetical protein